MDSFWEQNVSFPEAVTGRYPKGEWAVEGGSKTGLMDGPTEQDSTPLPDQGLNA